MTVSRVILLVLTVMLLADGYWPSAVITAVWVLLLVRLRPQARRGRH